MEQELKRLAHFVLENKVKFLPVLGRNFLFLLFLFLAFD